MGLWRSNWISVKLTIDLSGGFLEQMMRKLGFARIQLVMVCVTTISYSFKLNGKPVGYVFPKQGIRQGDLLFLFLFVICAECLLALFDVWEQQKGICGLTICVGASTIHHPLFAMIVLHLLGAL